MKAVAYPINNTCQILSERTGLQTPFEFIILHQMFAKTSYDLQTHLFRRAETFTDLERLIDQVFPALPFLYKIQYDDPDIGTQTISSTHDLALFYEKQRYNLDLILLTLKPEESFESKESSIQEIRPETHQQHKFYISKSELDQLITEKVQQVLRQRRKTAQQEEELPLSSLSDLCLDTSPN